MKKHTSEEAFYQRMRDLAESNKSVKSKTNSLGTLVDYKKANDGINYGIIKENHKYYIKNGGIKKDPNAADFTYIGGLSNITEYQYKTLAEAKKIRNMLFQTISDGLSFKFEKTGKKISLNENVNEETKDETDDDISEDKAEDEIDAADSKMPDLDVATEKAKQEPEVDMEMDTEMELGDEEMEMPEDDGENMDLGDDEDGEMKEIEKLLGKITNKIRNVEMTEPQIKYSVNTFLAAFKDKFPEVEVEDRKEMANKILKVVDDEDIESIGDEVEAGEEDFVPDELGGEENVEAGGEEEEMNEADTCNECGDFARYAESKGYTKESIKECEMEEIANLISGYANAHNDGKNDGDFDSVALFTTPEITDTLDNEYGHNDYTEKLASSIDTLNETTDEDKQIKIDELSWKGLKGAGKGIGKKLGNVAKKAGQAVSGVAQNVAKKVGDAATDIKHDYYAEEKKASLEKLKKLAANLGNEIAVLNQKTEKAGQEPVNIQSLLQTITSSVQRGKSADLGKYATTEGVEENIEEEETINEEFQDIMSLLRKEKLLSGDDKIEYQKLKDKDMGGNLTDDDFKRMMELLKNAKKDGLNEDDIINEDGISDLLKSIKNLNPEDKKQYDVLRKKIMNKVDSDDNFDEKDMNSMNLLLKGGAVTENEVNEEIRSTLSDLHRLIKDLSPEGKKEYEKVYKELVDTGELNKEDQEILKPENESKKEAMTETEVKIRKYIRNRIQENQGLKKSSLNESKKSKKIKSLDAIIDKELKMFEKKNK